MQFWDLLYLPQLRAKIIILPSGHSSNSSFDPCVAHFKHRTSRTWFVYVCDHPLQGSRSRYLLVLWLLLA